MMIKKTPFFLGIRGFFSFFRVVSRSMAVKKNYGHNHMVYFEIPVSYTILHLNIASWGIVQLAQNKQGEKIWNIIN